MKNSKFIVILPLLILPLAGCNQGPQSDMSYETKGVEVYRKAVTVDATTGVEIPKEQIAGYSGETKKKAIVDKVLNLRFYETTPHVPYISVKEYYSEFFGLNPSLKKDGNTYKYSLENKAYLKFDISNDTIYLYDSDAFSKNPNAIEDNSKYFLDWYKTEQTTLKEKAISLTNYGIDLHGDSEAYVPLTMLSVFSGGNSGFQVTYNGGSIFVMDGRGYISGEVTDYAYFGDKYLEYINDINTPRYEDMAKYAYGEICFTFDNFRGYTSQLIFGDNNLLTLGLNGLIEEFYPNLKTLLLSTEKTKYYMGHFALFDGLLDGGHTGGIMAMTVDAIRTVSAGLTQYDDLNQLYMDGTISLMSSMFRTNGHKMVKTKNFPQYTPNVPKENIGNYYAYDSKTETAYIGFDSFSVDLESWNKYYTQGRKESDLPSPYFDSYYFVLSSLKQAKTDNVKKVILDLASNGGGNSGALCGILGLFNGKAQGQFDMNDIVNQNRISEYFRVDVNLDGQFNEQDKAVLDTFNFQYAVLTSEGSFSCGNLLPSLLKEEGIPIVGQRSGGGSCAVANGATADGITFSRSSHRCLSDKSGHNLDDGVPVDFEIPLIRVQPSQDFDLGYYYSEQFYDFVTISDYLDSRNGNKIEL